MSSVLIFGASGLVGKHCVEQLLQNKNVTSIGVISRRILADDFFSSTNKIQQHIIDFELFLFEETEKATALFSQYDICLLCLGSTIKQAGSREAFARIDLDYTAQAAKLAKASGINKIGMISALGSHPQSKIFYSAVKGKAEQSLIDLNFDHCFIVRPSLILGSREEMRIGEDLGKPLMKLISPLLIGPLKKYRAIQAKDIAKGLIKHIFNSKQKLKYLYFFDLV